MAEHIACIFSVGALFVLCNPDKVLSVCRVHYSRMQLRSTSEQNGMGHQCHKWPLTIACGYGRDVPSNTYLVKRTKDNNDGYVDGGAVWLASTGGDCAA